MTEPVRIFVGTTPQDRDRFMDKVKFMEDDCWEWQACTHPNGYGKFTLRKKNCYAHRFSYEAFVEPVPDGFELDHLCRNRGCVNPHHLEVVTRQENNQRSWEARGLNTRCRKGHKYTEKTTLVFGDGRRTCRICYENAPSRSKEMGREYARRSRERREGLRRNIPERS